MNMFTRFLAARNIQVAAARRPGADKDGVVPFIQYRLQAVDVGLEVCMDAHVEDVVDLLIQNCRWQPEGGDLAAHKAAARRLIVIKVELIAKWRKISCNGE